MEFDAQSDVDEEKRSTAEERARLHYYDIKLHGQFPLFVPDLRHMASLSYESAMDERVVSWVTLLVHVLTAAHEALVMQRTISLGHAGGSDRIFNASTRASELSWALTFWDKEYEIMHDLLRRAVATLGDRWWGKHVRTFTDVSVIDDLCYTYKGRFIPFEKRGIYTARYAEVDASLADAGFPRELVRMTMQHDEAPGPLTGSAYHQIQAEGLAAYDELCQLKRERLKRAHRVRRREEEEEAAAGGPWASTRDV
jgi:hypothetical protein